VIFVDSNVPMYLVGAEHPHKADAQRILERCIARGERLVTDAEVLREILHRYVAIRRPDAIQPAFDAVLTIVDEVFSVTEADLRAAKDIVLGGKDVSARDALHAAVMRRAGADTILTFDAGFDRLAGITRLYG